MAPLRVAVATSGGRDSTALLHCTARAAAALGGEVLALHVHHGLMPTADAWLAHVRAQSRRWGALFCSQKLAGQPGPGDSVEAWARRGRYRALADMARAADCHLVLLAHHRQDQAETWLLQALRGAGPLGLSAMPAQVPRDGVVWARPWLACPRSRIEAYVHRHRLQWVEDPSNHDPRFARSRLRKLVWPALLAAFPDAESTLTQAASRAQDCAAVLAEVMAADLPGLQLNGGLNVKAWRALSAPRQRLSLRAWLESSLSAPVPGSLVQRLAKELPSEQPGARAASWPAGLQELRLYRGVLSVVPAAPYPTASAARPVASPVELNLAHEGQHHLPEWGGHFEVQQVQQGGVAAARLVDVRARARAGAERFQHEPSSPPRSLKKQYQSAGVPAWQRQGPLLFSASGELLFVPGLGADARCLARPGEPQLQLQWWPDPTGPRQPAG